MLKNRRVQQRNAEMGGELEHVMKTEQLREQGLVSPGKHRGDRTALLNFFMGIIEKMESHPSRNSSQA